MVHSVTARNAFPQRKSFITSRELVDLSIGLIPAVFASIFAAASASIASLSDARRRALTRALPESRSRSLKRYVSQGDTIEARWMVARVTCVAASAILVHQALPHTTEWFRVLEAIVVAVAAFSFPAEIAKALATRAADQTAPNLISILFPIELLAAPFAAPAGYVGRVARMLFPKDEASLEDVVEEEVELIVKDGARSGSIAPQEAQMLTNVLSFGEVTAKEVMVPRIHVAALSLGTDVNELLRIVVAETHSRYPVYQERIDNVVGILHVKDLLPYVAKPNELRNLELASILHRPVLFVSETQRAFAVLTAMRQEQQHMAVVIDEFGGMSGVLSLEDLLERIVGEIRDEHDEEEPPIVELGDGRFMVDASVSLLDLGRYLGTELPDDENYTSLGGMLVSQLGRVPQVGSKMSEFGLDFVVRDADERHVARVEIQRCSEPTIAATPLSLRSKPNQD